MIDDTLESAEITTEIVTAVVLVQAGLHLTKTYSNFVNTIILLPGDKIFPDMLKQTRILNTVTFVSTG